VPDEELVRILLRLDLAHLLLVGGSRGSGRRGAGGNESNLSSITAGGAFDVGPMTMAGVSESKEAASLGGESESESLLRPLNEDEKSVVSRLQGRGRGLGRATDDGGVASAGYETIEGADVFGNGELEDGMDEGDAAVFGEEGLRRRRAIATGNRDDPSMTSGQG